MVSCGMRRDEVVSTFHRACHEPGTAMSQMRCVMAFQRNEATAFRGNVVAGPSYHSPILMPSPVCAAAGGALAGSDQITDSGRNDSFHTPQVLEPEQWDVIQGKYAAAAAALDDREARIGAVAEQLETQMELLGVTAIEDKLQVSLISRKECAVVVDFGQSVGVASRARGIVWRASGGHRQRGCKRASLTSRMI